MTSLPQKIEFQAVLGDCGAVARRRLSNQFQRNGFVCQSIQGPVDRTLRAGADPAFDGVSFGKDVSGTELRRLWLEIGIGRHVWSYRGLGAKVSRCGADGRS